MKVELVYQQNKVHYKSYGILLLLCLLTYWPIAFGIFSSKGDSLQYFLPARYAISTAIQSGEFPFWSPWFYLGHPLYGDMQSGAWNPLVLFLSLFGKYTITTFHIEYLIYIFLGGVAMFRLAFYFCKCHQASLLIATSYMLGGVMLAGQVITWAASAAIIPFLLLSYFRLTNNAGWRQAISTGVLLWLLLVCGYPSYFIYSCYILFGLFIIFLLNQLKKSSEKKTVSWQRFFLIHVLLASTFIILSLPAIISYYDYLPYYSRGIGVSFRESLANSFEAQHFLSFIFPSEVGAPFQYSETDLTSRNIYLGIFILPVLIAYPPKFNRRNILLILFIIFSFLFSLGPGSPIRKITYEFLPLMDTFRHPAIIRVFGMIALLLLIVPGLTQLLYQISNSELVNQIRKFKFSLQIIAGIVLISATLALFKIFSDGNGLFNGQKESSSIKKIIDNYTFNDAVLINSVIHLLIIFVFFYWVKRGYLSFNKFQTLWIFNLFIIAQLLIPITFVSSYSPSKVNEFINNSAKTYSAERQNLPLEENSRDIENIYDRGVLPMGSPNFYKKTVAISHVLYNPSSFSSLDSFISNKTLYNFISKNPLVYIADTIIKTSDTSDRIFKTKKRILISNELPLLNSSIDDTALVTKLTNNSIIVSTKTKYESYLSLTQCYYPHWHVKIDGKNAPINKSNFTFMSVKVPAGIHQIKFYFKPLRTISGIWIMTGFIILLISLSIFFALKKSES